MDNSDNSVKAFFVVAGCILAGIFGLIVLFGSWTIISPQEVGIVTRVGALNRTLSEGPHVKIPMFEGVTKMNLSEQSFKTETQVYSKDTQTVTTQLVVNYQLNRSEVEQVFRETRDNYQQILIQPVLSPVIEEVFSRYTANELVLNRPLLPVEVKKAIVARLEGKGITIKGIEFTFDFDPAYEEAIKNKQVQEQLALGQINITKQEEEKKKQAILQAEALAEKTRLEAVALQSAQGEKLISKLYAEAAKTAADKWDGKGCTSNCYGQGMLTPVPILNAGSIMK